MNAPRRYTLRKSDESIIVEFDGGHVEVARTSDGRVWAHISTMHASAFGENIGRIVDARVDRSDKHAHETRHLAAPLLEDCVVHVACAIRAVKP